VPGSWRGAQGSVDHLGETEPSLGGELWDRLERRVAVKVGRGVAAKQGGEHPGNDPAPNGTELGGDAVEGDAPLLSLSQDFIWASDRM